MRYVIARRKSEIFTGPAKPCTSMHSDVVKILIIKISTKSGTSVTLLALAATVAACCGKATEIKVPSHRCSFANKSKAQRIHTEYENKQYHVSTTSSRKAFPKTHTGIRVVEPPNIPRVSSEYRSAMIHFVVLLLAVLRSDDTFRRIVGRL